MPFPQKLLVDDETVVIDQNPHWWTLVPRGAALLGAMAIGIWTLTLDSNDRSWVGPLRIAAAVLVVGALGWFLVRLVEWRTTNFVVTSDRCIYRSGIVSKQGIEIPLDRINTVFFNQSIFERVIGAGDIAIESAGEGSRQEFSDIRDPGNVQHEIYRQMEAYENRRQDRLGSVMSAGAALSETTQVQAGMSIPDQIAQLATLRDQGHLTVEEFEAKKAELLRRM